VGIEWLVGIDADELIFMARHEQVLENLPTLDLRGD
jgi:hypothetical protein